MGAQPNRAVMKGMKFILLLAAVGLLIAAVVMLFTGRGDTGELVMAGAVLAFLGYTVVAVKSKWATSTGNPIDHLNRAETLLGQGEYAAAARAAEAGLQAEGDGGLMRPFVLLVSAVSLAASGKHDRAWRALAALENVPLHDAATGYEPGVVFAQVIRTTTDYLNGGRSPETLVADYLRLSDVMFT